MSYSITEELEKQLNEDTLVRIPEALQKAMLETVGEYEHGSADYMSKIWTVLKKYGIFDYQDFLDHCYTSADEDAMMKINGKLINVDELYDDLTSAMVQDHADSMYDLALFYDFTEN
jgi:hypothetical protein